MLKFLRPAPRMRLLMVCLGNLCRSPMAQIVTLQLAQQAGFGAAIEVGSAGTNAARGSPSPDPRARKVLVGHSYPVPDLRAKRIIEPDFQRYDLILAMDQANMNDLRALCPAEHSHKLRLLLEFAPGSGTLDIPDPYYGNLQSFERVLQLVEAGAHGLIASEGARWK